MSDLQFNRDAWDRIAARRDEYYLAASSAAIEKARSGIVEIKLTPTIKVPQTWLGRLSGRDVLALASGGGLQGPLLAAAGAKTTVFDLSQGQLQRDLEVAGQFGMELKVLQGDMQNLSCFENESFDLIVNPCSICFCKNPTAIWHEIFRVLRPEGVFLTGLINPVNYLFDFFAAEKKQLNVRHCIPFEPDQLDSDEQHRWLGDERPIEYGHSIDKLIGGQLQAGLVLTGFYEDRWGDEDLLCDHLPVFFATRCIKKSN